MADITTDGPRAATMDRANFSESAQVISGLQVDFDQGSLNPPGNSQTSDDHI